MTSRFAVRRRRAAQKGLTLIEVLVASAIIGILAVPLGAALSLGVRELGGSRLQGHLASANDLLAVERQLGVDMGRADCVVAGGSWSCSAPPPCGTALCVATYDCHAAAWNVVSYSWASATGQVVRADSSGSTVVARHITGFNPQFVDLGSSPQVDVAITTTVQGNSRQSDVRLLPLPAQLGSVCS